MQHSEQINEIATALAKAQGEIKPAIKDSANPQFKGSKYADLAAIWAVCQEVLPKNGIAVIQGVENEGEFVVVTTKLIHSSGQWFSSSLSLKPTKQDPQGYGSAATYGRRYGLSAMVGVVADVDDDGNAATFGGDKPVTAGQRRATANEIVAAMNACGNEEALEEVGSKYIADINYYKNSLYATDNQFYEQIIKRGQELRKSFKEMEEYQRGER